MFKSFSFNKIIDKKYNRYYIWFLINGFLEIFFKIVPAFIIYKQFNSVYYKNYNDFVFYTILTFVIFTLLVIKYILGRIVSTYFIENIMINVKNNITSNILKNEPSKIIDSSKYISWYINDEPTIKYNYLYSIMEKNWKYINAFIW